MYVTAEKGILPQFAAKVNKNGVPVPLVVFQLTLTTVALVVLTNSGGSSNMSFLIALALTVVLYLITYFLLFLGYMVLVLKHPEKKRAYNIPGGTGVKLLVAGAGFTISLLAFVVSFFPPSGLPGAHGDQNYLELLVVSFLVALVIPFVVYALHDKRGKVQLAKLVHIKFHNAPLGHFSIHPRARGTHTLVPVETDKPTK